MNVIRNFIEINPSGRVWGVLDCIAESRETLLSIRHLIVLEREEVNSCWISVSGVLRRVTKPEKSFRSAWLL